MNSSNLRQMFANLIALFLGRLLPRLFTVVFVVLLMTGVTIGGRPFEDIILMTTFAGDSRVSAFEFESRKVVIELRGLPTNG